MNLSLKLMNFFQAPAGADPETAVAVRFSIDFCCHFLLIFTVLRLIGIYIDEKVDLF